MNSAALMYGKYWYPKFAVAKLSMNITIALFQRLAAFNQTQSTLTSYLEHT